MLVTVTDATPERRFQRKIKIGHPLKGRTVTFAPTNVKCAVDWDQIATMTAPQLRTIATTIVRIIVTSDPRLSHTPLLATDVKSSQATLPPAHAAVVMVLLDLPMHRERCSSQRSRLGQ